METETKQTKTKSSKSKSTKKIVETQPEVVEQSEVIVQHDEVIQQHELVENNIEEVATSNVADNDKNNFIKNISNINEFYIIINKYNFKKMDFTSEELKTLKATLASIGVQREKFAVKIIENFWIDKKQKKKF